MINYHIMKIYNNKQIKINKYIIILNKNINNYMNKSNLNYPINKINYKY